MSVGGTSGPDRLSGVQTPSSKLPEKATEKLSLLEKAITILKCVFTKDLSAGAFKSLADSYITHSKEHDSLDKQIKRLNFSEEKKTEITENISRYEEEISNYQNELKNSQI